MTVNNTDESTGNTTGTSTPIVIQEPSKLLDSGNDTRQQQQQQQQQQRHFLHHGSGADAKGGGSHRYFHHNGHRIRHFVRANGKKVHVASSPGEAEKMRRKMAVVDDDFDLVVHGTDEHVSD